MSAKATGNQVRDQVVQAVGPRNSRVGLETSLKVSVLAVQASACL